MKFLNFCSTDDKKSDLIKDKSSKKLDDTKEIVELQQIMMLAAERKYDMKALTTYELLPYPKALFSNNGFFKKSVTSELLRQIEKKSNCTTNLKQLLCTQYSQIHIFDGMVVVYMLQLNKYLTFGDFA